MNRIRRKHLTEAYELLEQARCIIEACRDEEQDAFDNLPEGIQASTRGEDMEENVAQMDDAISSIEEAMDIVGEYYA